MSASEPGQIADTARGEGGITSGRTVRPCARCAGTGEYPPTGGEQCSWCGGTGEYAGSDDA